MAQNHKRDPTETLKAIQERRRRRKEQERNVDWYSWLVSDHPCIVLFLCSCLIAGCVVVSVLYVTPPDFSEPSKGFEVRGTPLSDRVVTWKNLYDNTGYNQTLATYPTLYAKQRADAQRFIDKRRRKKDKNRRKSKPKTRTKREVTTSWNFTANGYFCHNPKPSYARMVIEASESSSNLWSVEGLHAICKAEKSLLSHDLYSDVCFHVDAATCCPTLSIANYVTFLSGLSTCNELNKSSLNKVSSLLHRCAPFYANRTLTGHCWDKDKEDGSDNPCPGVPKTCTRFNAVFSIFHYLTDTDFLSSILASKNPQSHHLSYTAVFLPALRNKHLAKLYHLSFARPNLDNNLSIQVTGLEFGLKDMVFNDTLHKDALFPIIAMSAVMVIIIIYTRSLFITLMSVVASIASLFMSYFLYAFIFEFPHFPFMNLTAIMVMVGIGADNVLVYCSAWQTYKDKDNCEMHMFVKKQCNSGKLSENRLGVVTRITLKHAARSMFVTGVTTASAFLANFSSTVTAIKCFGIYTGLTVLMNLFLCVTWLPAAVIVHEKHFSELYTKLLRICCVKNQIICSCTKRFNDASCAFFHKIQIYLIIRWRWVWLAIGTALAVGGCVSIFAYPKLRLPTTSSYFQYFKSSHPFERYTLTLSEKFEFEKKGLGYMPVTIIFGVKPTDNGDPMDPDDRGHLVFNSYFNMSDPKSQTWLLKFCEDARQQSFYKSTRDNYENFRMCFVEPFKTWMESVPCLTEDIDNTPCCKDTRFPYPPAVFNKCLKKAVLELTHTPGVRLDRLTPGPRFDINDTLRAVIVEFPSTQLYTGSYNDIADFYKNIELWLKKELKGAPPGLRDNAWFFSDLEFHALQLGLYQGTVTAIGLSMGIVCIALIVTTCNVTMTLLANVTIAFTIFVTVGILVLMGWELNILESVTISIAIGLSVDFTVHYAVAYLLVPSPDRITRVEHSASTMGPAIALAALTTFLAGFCMIPAQVTAYYKFGIFLMLVMVTSWFYGTYFFQALCSAIGPQGQCGQIGVCCCCKSFNVETDAENNAEGGNLSSSATKSSRICSNKKRTSSDSQSAAMIEMSSCTSA